MTVGLNVTVTVQVAPALNDVPHVFDCEKSPPAATPVSVRVAVPVFVIVTACPALSVPTFSLPKVKLVADNFTPGAVPVPVRLTV
jgi:hypothetical protein